jgi:hypothetical protein
MRGASATAGEDDTVSVAKANARMHKRRTRTGLLWSCTSCPHGAPTCPTSGQAGRFLRRNNRRCPYVL